MTDTTNTLPAPVISMQRLPEMVEKYMPLLEKRKAKANAALDQIQDTINSKEEAEDAIAILAAVREVYNANMTMRKEMTEITDAFKDNVMEYERDFNPDAKAKNKYNAKKKVIEDWQQREHDRIQQERAEAARRKDLENLKVDLKAKILQALSNNVIDTVKRADEYARTLFAALTVDIFDEEAAKFKKQNPKLKKETYDKCFEPSSDDEVKIKQYFGQPEAYNMFLIEVLKEETYDKWNAAIQEATAPVLNEWRARIPELKEECIAKSKASEEEKQRLEEERKTRDEAEKKQRQEQLDMFAKQNEQQIQEQAGMEKMSNSFAEQGVGQTLGQTGRTKLVMKFVDPKLAPKGFLEIVYQCMAHPDFQSQFPMFQKRDKQKKLMVDDKGRPVYVDAVQWWIDFWLANCDGVISGTDIQEDSKVTIRK